jgi:hypothetical protein
MKAVHCLRKIARILFLIRSRLPATLRPMPFPDPPPPDSDILADRLGPASGPLLPVDQAEVASALAYALRFDERGKPRRGPAWEMAAILLAEQLVAQLERANFVVLKRQPAPPHST